MLGRRLAPTAMASGSPPTGAARADHDAAIATYRQTTLIAFQQVEDSLAALRILEGKAQQQDEADESAKTNLDHFTARYAGGRGNYLQVRTAQTNYLQNERNEVEIRRRRLEASVLIIKALGGGWGASRGLALNRVPVTANTHP